MNPRSLNKADILSDKEIISIEKELEESGKKYNLRKKIKESQKMHLNKIPILHLIKKEDYDNKFRSISPEH
jgi:hypothetical protein